MARKSLRSLEEQHQSLAKVELQSPLGNVSRLFQAKERICAFQLITSSTSCALIDKVPGYGHVHTQYGVHALKSPRSAKLVIVVSVE